MSLKLKYNHALFILALLVLAFTIIFKFKTGSFFSISEKSRRAMIEYEIDKRKLDITIPSLKASCLDYDFVVKQLLKDINNSNNACVLDFNKKLTGLGKDSVYFKIIEKLYEHAYYYEEELTQNGRIVTLYQDKNLDCLNTIQIVFENKNKASLIKEIIGFPDYLSCYCD